MEMAFAKAQIEAGATLIGIGDAAASLIGPKFYERFVFAGECRLVQAIHAMGVPVRLHICGNTRRILKGMGRTGADIVDLDFLSPIPRAPRHGRPSNAAWQHRSRKRASRQYARIDYGGPGRMPPPSRSPLHCGRRMRGAARHPAREPAGHDSLRAQPRVKLEIHPCDGQTPRDLLFEQGVEFPCGGESACGGCRVRVLEGDAPVTAEMREALSEQELADGWRLACAPSRGGRVWSAVEQWSLRCSPMNRGYPSSLRRTGRGHRLGNHHAGRPARGSYDR